MTAEAWIENAARELGKAGIGSARLDALILLEYVTGKDRSWWLAHKEVQLPSKWAKSFSSLLLDRKKRVPLAHLTKHREFYGLDLRVSPDVMIPRPETEKLVELAIKYAPKNSSLIDVGSGCGAIAAAIAVHRPDLDIAASDISPAALKIATTNFKKHNLKIELHQGDLLSGQRERFEVITANLPYVAAGSNLMPEAQRDPQLALLGGEDGLDVYRRFFAQLPDYLSPHGHVFIESDPWQQPELTKVAHKAGLKVIEQDYLVLGFKKLSTQKLYN